MTSSVVEKETGRGSEGIGDGPRVRVEVGDGSGVTVGSGLGDGAPIEVQAVRNSSTLINILFSLGIFILSVGLEEC
jgi:hypothetical protein